MYGELYGYIGRPATCVAKVRNHSGKICSYNILVEGRYNIIAEPEVVKEVLLRGNGPIIDNLKLTSDGRIFEHRPDAKQAKEIFDGLPRGGRPKRPEIDYALRIAKCIVSIDRRLFPNGEGQIIKSHNAEECKYTVDTVVLTLASGLKIKFVFYVFDNGIYGVVMNQSPKHFGVTTDLELLCETRDEEAIRYVVKSFINNTRQNSDNLFKQFGLEIPSDSIEVEHRLEDLLGYLNEIIEQEIKLPTYIRVLEDTGAEDTGYLKYAYKLVRETHEKLTVDSVMQRKYINGMGFTYVLNLMRDGTVLGGSAMDISSTIEKLTDQLEIIYKTYLK